MDMIERACRALCQYNGVSPDMDDGGVPAWQSRRSEVLALISSLPQGDGQPHAPSMQTQGKPKAVDGEKQWS